jgi:RNA polymerase primary sigma factor
MTIAEDATVLEAARHGDSRAREALVAKHLGLIRSVAAHYRNLGLPFDDLVQEGSVGLLEAIDLFDHARGADFETYARFRARRAIRNALTEKSRLIRLPKQIVERRRAVERAEARLAAAEGHVPTARQVAAALGLPQSVVLELHGVPGVSVSLDQGILADGTTLEAVVADAAAPDPELEAIEREQTDLVDAALAALPQRQREIVSRHFGLGRTPEEIADVANALHLSQQRTRAIERDALYALRDRLETNSQSSSNTLRRQWKT